MRTATATRCWATDLNGQGVATVDHCVLIGGARGSGKSTALNAMLAVHADDPATAIVAIDLKRVELSPWEPRLSALAVDYQPALELLLDVLAIMDHRYRWMAQHGLRKWPVAETTPRIVLVTDELAALSAVDLFGTDAKIAKATTDRRRGALDRIAQLGRAAGIQTISATQRPAVENISADFRSNHTVRVCLAVTNRAVATMVLGEIPDGCEPWRLPLDKPGLGYVLGDQSERTARLIRANYLDDQAVADVVDRTSAHLCRIGLVTEWFS